MRRTRPLFDTKTAQPFNQPTIDQVSVMIVDDDKDFIEITRVWLENLGCKQIITATNGRDALRQIRKAEHKPQIVLLDINMPFDGYACCRVLRNDAYLKQEPFFLALLTADPLENAEVHRFRAGADMVLHKPLQFMDLFHTLLIYFQRQKENFHRHQAQAVHQMPQPSPRTRSRQSWSAQLQVT